MERDRVRGLSLIHISEAPKAEEKKTTTYSWVNPKISGKTGEENNSASYTGKPDPSEAKAEQTSSAVSYTHLDVYKRQDLYYIENWTLGLDFKILFLTFFKGFVNKNAY